MTNIIKLQNIELELVKEILIDSDKIKAIQEKIESLKDRTYDFTTKEGIAEALELKKLANKFVKELKEFCEPLEAEGKKISDARSSIVTKLITGKNSVIEEILKPVNEREAKIKSLNQNLFISSKNLQENAVKLSEIEKLNDYDWLAFREDAETLLERQGKFLLNEKIDMEAKEQENLEKTKIELLKELQNFMEIEVARKFLESVSKGEIKNLKIIY